MSQLPKDKTADTEYCGGAGLLQHTGGRRSSRDRMTGTDGVGNKEKKKMYRTVTNKFAIVIKVIRIR